MDLSIRARKQSARRIIHIDVLGCAHQFSLKFAARELSETKVCRHSGFDSLRVFLGDVYINPQFSGLSDVKEIGFYTATATGIDEVADIGVSSGDNSVERSVDLFEGLQRLELLYVRLIRLNDGLVGVVSARSIIGILLRDGISLQQPLVAVLGNLGEREVRLRGIEVAERLLQLLIDFRSLDHSQQLPFLHV